MSDKRTYSEQLKDPRWQRRRLEVLGEADFTCMVCDSKEKNLHVHHREYKNKKNKQPWEYEDDQLVALCFECHAKVKELQTAISKEVDNPYVFHGLKFAYEMLTRKGSASTFFFELILQLSVGNNVTLSKHLYQEAVRLTGKKEVPNG